MSFAIELRYSHFMLQGNYRVLFGRYRQQYLLIALVII